jgi:hypothetical protein
MVRHLRFLLCTALDLLSLPSVLADDSAGKSGDLYIRSVCFSPDGKYLATGAEDKQIRIWDIAKKRIRNVFDGHQQEIYSLDFSLDGRLIVSGSGDKTARIWDMIEGTSKVLTINDPDSLNNDAGVTSVAISPDGRFVAAGSLDTVVRIWDVATAQLVERLRGHRDSVYSVAFTPDGKGLVSGSLDKTLKYWDVSGLAAGTSGVKSRKEGAAGAPSGPGRKDGDKGSQCTMNFTGHKVRFPCSYLSSKFICCLLVLFFRITCSQLRSRMMARGSCLGQRTAGCSSGTRARRSCSACCRATRTVSSRSTSAPPAMFSPRAAAIGKRGYVRALLFIAFLCFV